MTEFFGGGGGAGGIGAMGSPRSSGSLEGHKPGAPLLVAKQIRKAYPGLEVLKGVDLEIYAGDALCIMGSSGAGKSTFLHILSALDHPSGGQVLFKGKDIFSLNDDDRSRFRNQTVGFVFQFHHLLSEFSALENVMMPALIGGQSLFHARPKALNLLQELGLADRVHHRPSEMSGGEQQRVAIARALMNDPQVIFADEPTGNLDQKNGQHVQSVLFELHRRRNLTLVAVTHDYDFARKFPKVRQLRDGQWL